MYREASEQDDDIAISAFVPSRPAGVAAASDSSIFPHRKRFVRMIVQGSGADTIDADAARSQFAGHALGRYSQQPSDPPAQTWEFAAFCYSACRAVRPPLDENLGSTKL
jgi:hypothetical protein